MAIEDKKGLKQDVFPIGEENVAYQDYFIGKSFLAPLVNDPANFDVNVSNVTFESGCRNDWHIHHDGYQILLVTGGEGWYQEWGQPAQRLKAGDVIAIKEGVKHWHGAIANSWFTHLAITKGSSEWLESVDDQAYAQLGKKA